MITEGTPFIENLIEGFEWTGKEGLRDGLYYSYPDSVGLKTIGAGHLFTSSDTEPLTRDQVYGLLKSDINDRLWQIRKLVHSEIYETLDEEQVAALLSWYYNTGARISTFWNLVNDKTSWRTLKIWWTQHYTKSKGVELPGLLSRRIKERDLFFDGASIA